MKLGQTWPLPVVAIREFVASVKRCVVVEEGDTWLADRIRALGLDVERKPEPFRFGELSVDRVRRILARDTAPEPVPAKGQPPQLCPGCPHRSAFDVFRDLGLTVSGDIGCYTLGVRPPFEAMELQMCMGAAIGMALGLRYSLPDDEARRVVSVIGDSTFVHGGLTGLVEMTYNPPKTGHVIVILDNHTTAMTGTQENPATGRLLNHEPTHQLSLEGICRAAGVPDVQVFDHVAHKDEFAAALKAALADNGLHVFIARRPCLLAAKRIRELDERDAQRAAANSPVKGGDHE